MTWYASDAGRLSDGAADRGHWQSVSGIAGTVRDSSGVVLPGVTVQRQSPALHRRHALDHQRGANGTFQITDP